jgi:Protein of unknown function (DUF3750)
VHSSIVLKEKGAGTYSRYDYTAWGAAIRSNGFAPDARWFGAMPETVVAVDGERAESLIPKIRYVIENYKFRAHGDYSAGPVPTRTLSSRPHWTRCPSFVRCCPPPQ